MRIDPATGALHLWEDRLPITPHMGKTELQTLIGDTKHVSDRYPPLLVIHDGSAQLSITFVLKGEHLRGLEIRTNSGRINDPEFYAALAARLGLAGSPAWGQFGHYFAHSGTDYEEFLWVSYHESQE